MGIENFAGSSTSEDFSAFDEHTATVADFERYIKYLEGQRALFKSSDPDYTREIEALLEEIKEKLAVKSLTA